MEWNWIGCFILFCIHLITGHKNYYYNHERIMNGIEVSEPFLWAAAIVVRVYNFSTNEYANIFTQFCGGAVISHRFILTAAHCVFFKSPNLNSFCPSKFFMIPPSHMTIIVGYYNLLHAKPEDLLPIKRIISHSQYHTCTDANDIALLELKNPLPRTQYVISVLHEWVNPGQEATLAGWGSRCLEEENKAKRNSMSYTPVEVKSTDQCSRITFDKSYNTMLCAGAKDRSIQQGDSGSGLWVTRHGKPWLIGVVSQAVYCSSEHCASLYTRLSHYKHWISNGIHGRFDHCDYYL